jgi:WD40 repeat protein
MLAEPGGRELFDAAISPDGELVAAGGADRTVQVWRLRTGELVARLRTPARVNAVAFSPDGSLVAAAAGRAIRVWRVAELRAAPVVLRDPSPAQENEFWSVAFAPNGEFVAGGNFNGAWSLWDVSASERVARAKGHADTVADVAFSGDGAYLVTAGWDGAAKVWAVPGGGLVTSFRTAASAFEAAAFAPRGRSIAVAGDDGRATVFECVECRPLRELVCLAEKRVTPAVRATERDAFESCD